MKPPRLVLPAASRWLLAATLAGLSLGAQAMSFSEALDAARQHDAAYRAANHELEVSRQGVPIARASLLPSISLTATESKITGSRRFPNAQNQEVRLPLDYSAPQASIGMRMPIFNMDALGALRVAEAQVEQADAVYRGQGMEMLDRLTGAYMEALLAEESKRLADAQVVAFEVQMRQTEQRLARGEGTRVLVAQALATLDVARTRALEAQDNLDLARVRLERITGVAGAWVRPLPEATGLSPLIPSRLGDWLDIAYRQSPILQVRQRNIDIARLARQRQAAGHLPRLDLIASISRNENDATNTIGQSTALRQVGVQLTVPIYSGGGVSAAVSQARSRESVAEEELRQERETLELDVQRHYQAVVNGERKVEAYKRAVESTALAAQGARRALETGLGTQSELVEAQTNNFTAARDLAQARIEVLVSRVRLLLRVGAPMQEVAAEVDRALALAPPAPLNPIQEPAPVAPETQR